MDIILDQNTVIVNGPAGPESYTFATDAEARARKAFVEDAISWIGTRFCDRADVKRSETNRGAVDCAMMLRRCAIDTGLVPPFDAPKYPPRWHMHQSDELFINFLTETFNAREIETPRFADIAVWKFGKTFSHAGVLINSAEVIHAYYANRMVVQTLRNEPLLSQDEGSARDVRYFDLWSAVG